MNNDDLYAIMDQALHALRREAGLGYAVLSERAARRPGEPDAVVRLRLPNGQELQVCVEARRSLRPAAIPELLARLDQFRKQAPCTQAMVVAPYIPRPLAERLRKEGIWFADAVGNAYLKVPDALLFYVVGQRPSAPALAGPVSPSAAAAKVFFRLLVLGPEVTVTYRDIAWNVGVSLGLVSRTITALAGRGILHRRGRGNYTIADPHKLLEMWSEAYESGLRRRLFRGRFRAPSGSDFAPLLQALRKERALRGVVVGGELAADFLTGYLRAGSLNLYVPRGERSVQKALNLAPSAEGNIEVYETFSRELGTDLIRGEPLAAHPVLVYAELLATGDPRCGEAALRLKEKYLPWIP